MVRKTATAGEITAAKNKLAEVLGESAATAVVDADVREYMLKWLSAFASDMTFADAKSFCLPRRMYRNYLWNAFSFHKTDAYMDEEADERYGEGFNGRCYLLLNTPNLLYSVEDGTLLTREKLEQFENVIVFTEDFSETYVYTGAENTGPYYKHS